MVGKVFTKHQVKNPAGYRAQLDKSALMRVVAALASDSALPQPGKSPLYTQEPRRQEHLASRIGLKCRESFSRNFRKSPKFVTKNFKRAAKACVYAFAFDQGKEASYIKDGDFRPPRPGEMRKRPEFAEYFSEMKDRVDLLKLESKGTFSDYAWIPGWIFHPSAPGNALDRLVLLVLAFHGLFAINKENGRMEKEVLQLSYTHIAACIGIHRDTVARCMNFWRDKGLLSIEEQPGHWTRNGVKVAEYQPGDVWNQEANKIWYLPGKEFNEAQAIAEIERFSIASMKGGIRSSGWWPLAADAHTSVVKEFVGQRHTIGRVWGECSARMRDRGVPEDYIRALIPRPPG